MKSVEKLQKIIKKASPDVRKRLFVIFAVLLLFNFVILLSVIITARVYPVLLGLAVLAYGFGLRHAVDPDHIAAIDNTTRKLMQDGKRPVAVGFFFSLGHSTVVVALSAIVAVSSSFVHTNLPSFKETGSIIGTSVSAIFLLAIGIINLLALKDIFFAWRKVVRGGKYDETTIEDYLHNRGFFARIFKPILKVVSDSSNMYPIGLLFGLGFDTASEVGLLSLSAATGTAGVPVWGILLLPLAFTAGMSLIDTLDGILMLGAYGWAYIKPIRKLYYNMNITFISVIIALFIGGIEALQILNHQLKLNGSIFNFINNIELTNFGFIIIAIFITSWIISVLIYKLRGYDLLEMSKSS